MSHNQRPGFHTSSLMKDQSSTSNSDQLCSQFNPDTPCFDTGIKQVLPGFPSQFGSTPYMNYQAMEWDPRATLSTLSFLEDKIHQLQDLIRSIVQNEGQFQLQPSELAAQQQQLVNADLTCLITQLISTAGSLLPSMKNATFSGNPLIVPLASLDGSGSSSDPAGACEENRGFTPEPNMNSEDMMIKGLTDNGADVIDTILVDDQEVKDGEDGAIDVENLPPGSYEVLQLEKEEILAPHTHFCSICGKGFKRDANLRMHMRGHGDEYKSPSALAKPPKEPSSEPVLLKRYSCPFVSCKRNKEHKNFQPLKTILCVKNHYKRSHCEKSYSCSRCKTKRFSVIADLKTHEKHCGSGKWLCSCGTTFSRKDKLFGHVALFQGHTPALPPEEPKVPEVAGQARSNEEVAKFGNGANNFMWNSGSSGDVFDSKGFDNPSDDIFASVNFGSETFSFGGLDGFSRPTFDASESSFPFTSSGSFDNLPTNGEN